MKKIVTLACSAALAVGTLVVVSSSAVAGTQPAITKLSSTRAAYWGGRTITVRGLNFTNVRQVLFGNTNAWTFHVVSPTKLTAMTPYHGKGRVYVRVVTATGRSVKTSKAKFTFSAPKMSDPIQGGLTARQAQKQSAKVRAKHKGIGTARGHRYWTASMGKTAARRATSWLGLPYSWAGGNGSGPTRGVCAGDGGDLDCHIVGFDCSGLSLNAWWPYRHLAHYAATQRRQAGRFHPAVGELMPGDLVFFSGYISNGIGHVAIYAGNGWVIQAPQSGSVVSRDRLSDVIASHGKYRGATRPMSTGRQGSGPAVTTITPRLTTAGGAVTIRGRNLSTTTSVTVGKTTYYSFARRTASTLVLKLPASRAGTKQVRISNAWGTVRRSLVYVKPIPVTKPTAPVPSVSATAPVGKTKTTPAAPSTTAPSSPATTPATSPATAPATSPATTPATSPATTPATSPATTPASSSSAVRSPAAAGASPTPRR